MDSTGPAPYCEEVPMSDTTPTPVIRMIPAQVSMQVTQEELERRLHTAQLENRAACWGTSGPGGVLVGKVENVALDVRGLKTTVRLVGGVISLAIVVIGALGLLAIRGIAYDVRQSMSTDEMTKQAAYASEQLTKGNL